MQNPYAGSFDVIKNTSKGEEHINVNYVLQPAPFINVLTVDLNTPDPMQLSVEVLNDAGAPVITWKPEQISYSYEKQIDISNLKAGTYKLVIYGEGNKKLHSVVFPKQNSSTNQSNTRK